MSSSSDPDLSDGVAIAALVISTFALLGVAIQYVQTVMSAARGLPNVEKEVMELWAGFARTKWRRVFRVEVEYEAPAIFLSNSENKKGPVRDVDIWYVDGSQRSCKETRVEEPPRDTEDERARVSTVKNELATWILVIKATQKMERDSKQWEGRKWRDAKVTTLPKLPSRVDLCVNIQPVKRSFDKHPAIRRPYATSTVGHMVALCAMLGIFWKEFDRDKDKYRAEGNGYSVLGARIPDFGLVFTFEQPGWPEFKKNRVIPIEAVKELCFGNVPTFYRPTTEDTYWDKPINEQADFKTLQLGSRDEIAETLTLIRCTEYTTQCYSNKAKKHIHLFPVIFEVLGMVARTFHIKDRPFTYLPNPVAFLINTQAFSLRRLLREFTAGLHRELDPAQFLSGALKKSLDKIKQSADGLEKTLPSQDGDFTPPHLNDIHDAIDTLDRVLLEGERPDKTIVLDVLRRHVQEVLLAINTSARDVAELQDGSGSAHPPTPSPAAPRPHHHHHQQQQAEGVVRGDTSFDDLLSAAHEHRERVLMAKYFGEIRPRATSLARDGAHYDPQATEASWTVHHGAGGAAAAGPEEETEEQARRTVVWCALVLRMVLWLLLHNFDKKDVQLPKSELMGSRLPVFIV